MSDYFGTVYGGGSHPRYPRRSTQTTIGWDPVVVADIVENLPPTHDQQENLVRPVPPPGSGEKKGM